MLNLLFSPNGRLNPSEFKTAALILIGLGFVIGISSLISYSLSQIFGILSLITLWCWIAIWIKRYHDGDKPGVMCLVPIAVFVVAYFILNAIMSATGLNGVPSELQAQIDQETQDAMLNEGFMASVQVVQSYAKDIAQMSALPTSIAQALLAAAVAFGFNAMIKHDPNDNQYGPAH